MVLDLGLSTGDNCSPHLSDDTRAMAIGMPPKFFYVGL